MGVMGGFLPFADGRRFSLCRLFWKRPLTWLSLWIEAADRGMTMQAVVVEALERRIGRP